MAWLGSLLAVSLVLALNCGVKGLEEAIEINLDTRTELTQLLTSLSADFNANAAGLAELKNQTSELLSDIAAFKSRASAEETSCRQLFEWSEEMVANFDELRDVVKNETSSWRQSSVHALEELVRELQRGEASVMQGLEQFNDGLRKVPQPKLSEALPQPSALVANHPKDCSEAQVRGGRTGVTTIAPEEGLQEQVWCDQVTGGGGWMVIIRRQKQDRQLDFSRGRQDYRDGFGDASGEYWLGLDAQHALTGDTPFELLVTMAIGLEKASSYYNSFSVGGPNGYRLSVSGYDAPRSTGGDSLTYHDGQDFTTNDNDKDGASGGNCADWSGGGGWWYDYCFFANPTGLYSGGKDPTDYADSYLEWRKWQGYNAYLTDFAMMIRPKRD